MNASALPTSRIFARSKEYANATAAIAKKLLQDTGATCNVTLTEAELAK